MSVETHWQLAGLLQLASASVLPAALFLAARRWPLLARLALAVGVAWVAGVLAQAWAASIHEAHYLARYRYNPTNPDDYGPLYDDTAANGFVVFLGWLPPLLVCLLVAAALWVVRLARPPRPSAPAPSA